MKAGSRIIVIALGLCLWCAAPLTAKTLFRSSQLEKMATCLHLDTISRWKAGWHMQHSYGKRPLSIYVSPNGQIEHIGVQVFSAETKNELNLPIYNFLERYYLATLLPLWKDKTVAMQIAEDGIEFSKGSFASFDGLNQNGLNISITNHGTKRYTVTWSRNDKVLCSISFPVDYQLLLGVNKNEAESRLPAMVRMTDYSVLPLQRSPAPKRLVYMSKEKMYVEPGESYMSEKITSRHYCVRKKTNEFHWLYTSEYPAESLANMVSGVMKNEKMLSIELRKYNYECETFAVHLDQWISFCQKEHCEPYFGVEELSQDSISASLFMVNNQLGYNHIMFMKMAKADVAKKGTVIRAHLHCYVPINNIGNLYHEYTVRKRERIYETDENK